MSRGGAIQPPLLPRVAGAVSPLQAPATLSLSHVTQPSTGAVPPGTVPLIPAPTMPPSTFVVTSAGAVRSEGVSANPETPAVLQRSALPDALRRIAQSTEMLTDAVQLLEHTSIEGVSALSPITRERIPRAALLVMAAAVSGMGDAQRPAPVHLLSEPRRFWAALYLLALDMPESWVEGKCLLLGPNESSGATLQIYHTILAAPGVRAALRHIAAIGLEGFLRHTQLIDTTLEAEAAAATRIMAAADHVRNVIDTEWPAALACGMTVGPELECLAWNGFARLGDQQSEPHDVVYERLAVAYENDPAIRERGLHVVLDRVPDGGTVPFEVGGKHFKFLTIIERFCRPDLANAEDVRVVRLEGTGGVLLGMDPGSDQEAAWWPATGEGRSDIYAAEGEAYGKAFAALGVSTVGEVRALRTRTDNIVMVKSRDGDMAKAQLTFYPDGRVVVRGINGKFAGPSGALLEELPVDPAAVDLSDLQATVEWVDAQVSRPGGFHRTDKIRGLTLVDAAGIERMRLVLKDEAHPFIELVREGPTPADEVDWWQPALRAFADNGYRPTTSRTLVGFHVHANLPEAVTVAPLLSAMAVFFNHAAELYALIPSSEPRRGFMQYLCESLRQKVRDPRYVVDPADPGTILCVAADFAAESVAKYQEVNGDNQFAFLLRRLLEDGRLTEGPHSVDWHGATRVFRVGREEKTNEPQIWWENAPGGAFPLVRVSPSVQMHTFELRFPDTAATRPTTDRYRIDPKAFSTFVKYVAGLFWRHGNAGTV